MIDKQEIAPIERLFSPTASTRLYAFLLKLRPLQQGTLMPFCGELVHAAFLHWLRTAAPDVSKWLHEGNKRRLFTCSSLQWPLPRQRTMNAERDNIHMPLDPQETYTVRITLLIGELFPLFHKALMDVNAQDSGSAKPPFIQLGKQFFLLEEVILDPTSTIEHDPASWTGFISLGTLVESAKALKLSKIEPLTLEFDSLTTFNRSSQRDGEYGSFFALLPLPYYIFPGLARRWEDVSSPELAGIVQEERIEQYTQRNGAIIVDYTVRPHHVKFTTHTQSGFIGTCKYHLRGPDEPTTAEAPLTVRQQLLLLAQLAFYTGIGYKTSMGLGRVRPWS